MVKRLMALLQMFCATALFVMFFTTTNAFAGANGSTSDGSSGHGSGTGSITRELDSVKFVDFVGGDPICNDIGGDSDEATYGQYLNDDMLGDYDDGTPRYVRWNVIFRNWSYNDIDTNDSDNEENWTNKHLKNTLDGALIKEAENWGYYWEYCARSGHHGDPCEMMWYQNNDTGDILDAVWTKNGIRKKPPKKEDGYKRVLVYVSGGKGEQIDDRCDISDEAAIGVLYNSGRDSAEYWDKTPPEKRVAYSKIDSIVWVLHHWLEKVCYGKGKDRACYYVDRYEYIDSEFYTKDFTYNTITPTIKQEPFKPWNLNRNGYATIDDISSQYAHAKLPIELDVNNNQGIYDNSPLKALDINNDTFFKFKFTNGYLGMPSVFNWTNPPGTPPGILNNGTWEDAGSGGYANGRNAKADKDGLYRYNVKLHMSMSPNTKKPFVDTSSINFNGSEFTTSEEALQRPPWAGGELSTRFTYADTYWTDNNKEGSKFPAWWVNTYTMGRFYEYGSEWHGLVTLSGIEDPNNVMYGTGQSTGYDSYKITIDANKQQKGLYVGYASANFEQPIITGTWEVKTVAGYVN